MSSKSKSSQSSAPSSSSVDGGGNTGSLRTDLMNLMSSLGFQVNAASSSKPSKSSSTSSSASAPASQSHSHSAASKSSSASSSASADSDSQSKSQNKNTLKNKARRQKQKQRDAPSSSAPTSASSDSALRDAENRVKREAQRYAEENAKKFKEIARGNDNGGIKWYEREEAKDSAAPDTIKSAFTLTADLESRIKLSLTKAEAVMAAYVERVQKEMESKADRQGSDENWMRSVLSSGTLTDKVAALTLLIQQNPVARLSMIERLIAMAQKKGKRESQLAIDSLRDLFISDLLPPNRALRPFGSHAYFRYSPNRKSLDTESGNLVIAKAPNAPTELELMFWLYEDRLKHWFAVFLQVLESATHDPMTHIKQSALNTLSTMLSNVAERERQLLALIVNKLGDPERKIGSRVISLLSDLVLQNPGMKLPVIRELEQLLYRPNITPRAQYFAVVFCTQIIFLKDDADVAKKLIELYFKLFKLMVKKGENGDKEKEEKEKEKNKSKSDKDSLTESMRNRFLGALLTGVNRALPYAGLDLAEFESDLELLFSLIHTSSWSTGLQSLLLLFQIVNSSSALATEKFVSRFYRVLYAQLLSPELVRHTKKQSALFLNLLFKALKYDSNVARTCAFVRRLLQIALHTQPNFIAGILILIGEVLKLKPAVKLIMQQSELAVAADEEEVKSDSKDGEESKSSGYDPSHRTPEFSNADGSCAWELDLLLNHFHPSIISFSDRVLGGSTIAYDGDPLTDFTPMAFLDKFAFKNPKKPDERQRKQVLARKVQQRALMAAEAFKGKPIESIREEDLFLYQYFSEKERREAEKPKEQYADETEEEFADRVIMAEMERLAGKADVDDEIDEEWDDQEAMEEQDVEAWGEEFDMSDEDQDGEEQEEQEGELPQEDDEQEWDVDEDEAIDEQDDEEDEIDDDDDDDDGSGSDDLDALLDGGAVGRRRGADSSASVFASADEFSSILNETMDSENSKERKKIAEWQAKIHGKSRNFGKGRGQGMKRGNPTANAKQGNKKKQRK